MIANFEIEESIALRFEGKYLDLHNCYDFIGYHHHINGKQLILTFSKTDGDWVREADPEKVVVIHHNVSFLNISYLNKIHEFPNDDKCLADITFFPSDDRITNDRIVLQKNPTSNDDIIYMFQSDYFIRVGCATIELLTEI